MLAYCGLNCLECGAYIATEKNDDALRAKVAKEWSEMFKVNILPEAINCTGCKSDGVQFAHCSQCEIRACAMQKNLDNCGLCDDFVCEKVAFVVNNVPDAQKALQEIHQNR